VGNVAWLRGYQRLLARFTGGQFNRTTSTLSLKTKGPIMNKFNRNALSVLFVTLFSVAISHGQNKDKSIYPCGYGTGHACSSDTPEINPEMGAGALALIGGFVMVIRGRRKA
jgi:hypothetical protein